MDLNTKKYNFNEKIDLYVINLEERKDRWDNIIKTYDSKYFNLIRINAIKERKGWIGCLKSHIECIKLAKNNNLKNIMVIEDDCIPMENQEKFIERIFKIKKYLDSSDDWEIYLGGTVSAIPFTYDRKIVYEDETFVESTKAYATHMICYNHKVYDLFLSLDNRFPIDEIWHGKCKAIISVPFVVKQKSGYSDIVQGEKSDDKRINEANAIFMNYIKS